MSFFFNIKRNSIFDFIQSHSGRVVARTFNINEDSVFIFEIQKNCSFSLPEMNNIISKYDNIWNDTVYKVYRVSYKVKDNNVTRVVNKYIPEFSEGLMVSLNKSFSKKDLSYLEKLCKIYINIVKDRLRDKEYYFKKDYTRMQEGKKRTGDDISSSSKKPKEYDYGPPPPPQSRLDTISPVHVTPLVVDPRLKNNTPPHMMQPSPPPPMLQPHIMQPHIMQPHIMQQHIMQQHIMQQPPPPPPPMMQPMMQPPPMLQLQPPGQSIDCQIKHVVGYPNYQPLDSSFTSQGSISIKESSCCYQELKTKYTKARNNYIKIWKENNHLRIVNAELCKENGELKGLQVKYITMLNKRPGDNPPV